MQPRLTTAQPRPVPSQPSTAHRRCPAPFRPPAADAVSLPVPQCPKCVPSRSSSTPAAYVTSPHRDPQGLEARAQRFEAAPERQIQAHRLTEPLKGSSARAPDPRTCLTEPLEPIASSSARESKNPSTIIPCLTEPLDQIASSSAREPKEPLNHHPLPPTHPLHSTSTLYASGTKHHPCRLSGGPPPLRPAPSAAFHARPLSAGQPRLRPTLPRKFNPSAPFPTASVSPPLQPRGLITLPSSYLAATHPSPCPNSSVPLY